MKKHPAKYSKVLFPYILECLKHFAGRKIGIVDNMGGIGGVHQIRTDDWFTVALEIEWDWACQHPSNVCGDTLHPPFQPQIFDAIVVSIVYYNRMSDHHNAKDGSKRNTYTHVIGHELHENNAGKIQWNDEAREFSTNMAKSILECLKRSKDARFVLNISDHIRKGEIQEVTKWHIELFESLGMKVVEHHKVQTRRNRQGRNGNLRVDHESVISFGWA